MPTLLIDHEITDLRTWLEAFNRFKDARAGAGVTSQRVCQPTDDDKYIFVELDFDSVEAAASFKSFLETVVWQSSENSPGLRGAPRARVLVEVDA
jgi:hypothetical protein